MHTNLDFIQWSTLYTVHVEVHFIFSTFTSAAWRSGCAFVKLTLVASQMANICISSPQRISGKDTRNVFSLFNKWKLEKRSMRNLKTSFAELSFNR